MNGERNRNRKAPEVVKESPFVFRQYILNNINNNTHTGISHFQFHRGIPGRRKRQRFPNGILRHQLPPTPIARFPGQRDSLRKFGRHPVFTSPFLFAAMQI